MYDSQDHIHDMIMADTSADLFSPVPDFIYGSTGLTFERMRSRCRLCCGSII